MNNKDNKNEYTISTDISHEEILKFVKKENENQKKATEKNRLNHLKKYLEDSGWKNEGIYWMNDSCDSDKRFMEHAVKYQVLQDRELFEADRKRR